MAAEAAVLYGAAESTKLSTTESGSERLAPYFAELVGTFVLVFTVGCCELSPALAAWGPMAMALVLMAMTYAIGPVSGANLNPAISISLAMVGAISWKTTLKYTVSQLIGGISAAACCCRLFAPKFTVVEPVAPFDQCHAMLAELIYTTFICFVFSSCCVSESNNSKHEPNQFYALAVGLAVIAGGYASHDISGACFNPAVSLGLSLVGGGLPCGLAFAAAEALGGLAAAGAFHALWPEEHVLPVDEHSDHAFSLPRRCGSECLGTFFLVLTVGLNVTMSSPASALSAGAALACMVYSLGNLSGGHFNPAVTLGLAAAGLGPSSHADCVCYALAQVLGGVAGGRVYAGFHAAGPNSTFTYGLGPGRSYGPTAAGVTELVFTCVLVYAVLTCASTTASRATKQNFYCALTVGSCVMFGGVAVGAISGGELNPAVSMGIATASHSHHGAAMPPPFANCIFFALWELAGGLLATVLFCLTRPELYMQARLQK